MAKDYTATELEAMSAAERAEAIKAAVVTERDEVDEDLLARGRERLAERFSELTS
ncbi:MAG: hypothetical protein AAGA93_17460 [Actinomycetota bacterium]